VDEIVSHAGRRVNCEQCGEEIVNERELTINGVVLCRACAGGGYYCPTPDSFTVVEAAALHHSLTTV
jgi:hypothetical protein